MATKKPTVKKKSGGQPGNKNAVGNNGGRPRHFETPELLQAAIDKYYAECKADERPKTFAGLAIALGMTRASLHDYEKRTTPEFSTLIKKARELVVSEVESMLVNGKGNAAGPIFWLKNNGGYADKQEIEQNIKYSELSDKELDEKLKMLTEK